MDEQLEKLVQQVQSSAKYSSIYPDLVSHIAEIELKKGRSWKVTVKAIRNKLHQVGAAYQEQEINYDRLASEMRSYPHDLQLPEVKRYLIQTMSLHASTKERLHLLDSFFMETLSSLQPVTSVLDVACGLNPLAYGWMPLSADAQITVCDIYLDQIEFLNVFFDHFGINGKAFCCDLTRSVPQEKAQVGLVLKTIPCLEQIDKNIGIKVLQGLQCDNLLVSYPAQSLGGKKKGMRNFYSAQFEQILKATDWKYSTHSFRNEEAFLITK
jgi:16S rRNA (guanine(1405)-N(7))-methyltransferase